MADEQTNVHWTDKENAIDVALFGGGQHFEPDETRPLDPAIAAQVLTVHGMEEPKTTVAPAVEPSVPVTAEVLPEPVADAPSDALVPQDVVAPEPPKETA